MTDVLAVPTADIIRPLFGAAADDITDLDLLHSISVALLGEQDLAELYGKIVDAAVAITRSSYGTMQRLCPKDDPSGHGGELQLLCSRNLTDEAAGFWAWVNPAAHSSCTAALKSGRRTVIADYDLWDEIAGTEDLAAFKRAGIRAAQTTPLYSRGGELLGMISTHWDEPHEPSARDQRMLDILARQAADLLERAIALEALRASEHKSRLLAGEAEHRTKNLLMTVLATVQLSNGATPEALKEVIGGRVQALADVNALFVQSRWAGADVRKIVAQELAPYGDHDGERTLLTGPDLLLEPESAQVLAVTLHELATNAAKYGALSVEGGKVAVDWSLAANRRLQLRWTESGGPVVRPPTRRGFGTRAMHGMTAARGGTMDFRWLPTGLVCDIVIAT